MFSALAGSVFVLGIGILMACAMDGALVQERDGHGSLCQAQGPPYRQTKLTKLNRSPPRAIKKGST